MPAPQVHLEQVDAAELAEALTPIGDWLDGPDHAQLATSFHRFIGINGINGINGIIGIIGIIGYDLTALRTDLARFTFLLGHDDGEQLFGTDEN